MVEFFLDGRSISRHGLGKQSRFEEPSVSKSEICPSNCCSTGLMEWFSIKKGKQGLVLLNKDFSSLCYMTIHLGTPGPFML